MSLDGQSISLSMPGIDGKVSTLSKSIKIQPESILKSQNVSAMDTSAISGSSYIKTDHKATVLEAAHKLHKQESSSPASYQPMINIDQKENVNLEGIKGEE